MPSQPLATLTTTTAPLGVLAAQDATRPPRPLQVELATAPLPWVRPLSTALLLGGQRN